MEKPPAIIVDIDGTLADIRHRLPYKKSWVKFNRMMVNDAPIQEVIDLVQEHKENGRKVILMTGRQSTYHDLTVKWLMKHKVPFDMLLMRDNRKKNHEMKREWYRTLLTKFDVELALDDDINVLEMWMDESVPVLSVRSYRE